MIRHLTHHFSSSLPGKCGLLWVPRREGPICAPTPPTCVLPPSRQQGHLSRTFHHARHCLHDRIEPSQHALQTAVIAVAFILQMGKLRPIKAKSGGFRNPSQCKVKVDSAPKLSHHASHLQSDCPRLRDKYLWRAYYVLGAIPSTRDTSVNKTVSLPSRGSQAGGGDRQTSK